MEEAMGMLLTMGVVSVTLFTLRVGVTAMPLSTKSLVMDMNQFTKNLVMDMRLFMKAQVMATKNQGDMLNLYMKEVIVITINQVM
jgi:hypothetical protein